MKDINTFKDGIALKIDYIDLKIDDIPLKIDDIATDISRLDERYK